MSELDRLKEELAGLEEKMGNLFVELSSAKKDEERVKKQQEMTDLAEKIAKLREKIANLENEQVQNNANVQNEEQAQNVQGEPDADQEQNVPPLADSQPNQARSNGRLRYGIMFSAAGILTTLAILCVLRSCNGRNNDNQPSNTNTPDTSVSDTFEPTMTPIESLMPTAIPTMEPTAEPTVKVEDVFTDVNDIDGLTLRVEELYPYFHDLANEYNISVEEIEEILNYINGGVVNEVSREASLRVITEIEEVMNNESVYAVDMLNRGESGHLTTDYFGIDYGKFFLDGSNGQKLARQISDLRRAMIAKGEIGEDITAEAEEFVKLLMNSWYLNGNGVISAYALETSGMEALIDKLFLNTAALAGTVDIKVVNPLNNQELTLEKIVSEINKGDCPLEVVADNGERFTQYVNKFTYDMEGMLKEASYNKLADDETARLIK